MSLNRDNIMLVARREFRQIASMRSFWITLLLIPLALALGPVLAQVVDEDEASRVVLIDRSGGSARAAVLERFGLDQDRRVMRALSRHVQRYDLADAAPDAVWTRSDSWFTDADVAAFRSAGGVENAQRQLAAVQTEETPAFDAPEPYYEFTDGPGGLRDTTGDALETQAQALVDADRDDGGADMFVLLEDSYAERPVVRLWTNEQVDPDFVTTLQDVLTIDLRRSMMTSQGIAPQSAAMIETAAPAIAVTTPPPGSGAREALFVRSIIPLALSYVLMMSLMLSGSWMLQSSIEERSNKLLESLLACVRADELMYGKLIGTVAIGLSMIAVWVACAATAVFFTQGAVSEFLRPALEPLTSPWVILAIIYFFIAGYIAVSIIFLAIGAMSDSMSDAQGYLMPVLLGILVPITFLLQAVVSGGGGIVERVLTWVPLWTPFAVLARLGSGIPTWELIGSGFILAAFVALEFVLLGRLFRASLLAKGQKPTLKMLRDRLRPVRD